MTQSAMDFYAYWNGTEVADLWTTVSLITGTGDYRSLLLCVAILGLICVCAGAAVRNRGGDIIVWIAAMIFIFMAAFVPRVDIAVKDVRSGHVQVVQNVPLGIGWPASVISRVSYWLTDAFETAFGDVDAAKYTRFGVAFPQRVVTTMLAVKPLTADGKVSLSTYAERCIVPEMLESPAKRQALLNAPDIHALVSGKDWVNPARRILMNGKVMTCTEASAELVSILEKHEIPALESRLGMLLSVKPDDAIDTGVIAAIPQAEALMLGVSRTMTESLRQSLMMSAIPDATMTLAAKTGQAPLSAGVAIARSQGNLASEINYRTLSEMARSALPKLRNILEFTVIGLWPIVFLMMIGTGSGGAMVCRAYFTLLVSVGLWAPITAIINYMTVHLDAEPLNRLVDQAGGVTLAAASMIRDGGASSQAMAGSLMWLVPVLAYAVAKGSDMALTAVTSSVLSPAASAAQAQGSQLAMGNVSAGNASVGNVSSNSVSANKTDASSSWSSQNLHESSISYGTASMDRASHETTSLAVRRTSLGVAADTQDTHAVNDVNSYGNVNSSTNASSVATQSGVQTLTGNAVTNNVSRENGWSVTQNAGTTFGTNESANYGTVNSSSFNTNAGRSGKSDNNFSYQSGVSVTSRLANTFNTEYEGVNQTKDNTDIGEAIISQNGVLSSPLAPSSTFLPQAPMFAANGMSTMDKINNGGNKTRNSTAEDKLKNDMFKINAGPTASNNASLSDFSGISYSSGKQSTYQSGHALSMNEQTGESTAIRNGTGNTLNDSSNAQFTEQTGLTEGRTVSQNTSAQNAATHTASKATAKQTRQEGDNRVRDLGLAMADGDAFAALKMFNSSSESRAQLGASVDQTTPHTEVVTAPQPAAGTQSNEAFLGVSRKDIETNYQAATAGVQAVSDDSVRRRSTEATITMPTKADFMAQTRKERDQANFRIGLSLVSTSEYLQTETGIRSVLERAFGGALTYSSPQEMYAQLSQSAEQNQELKEVLTKLGSVANSNLSDKEIISAYERTVSAH